MSIIGKNIRKIRGVKNMNQSDFAELFGLKRASIGAYEEGRAEPKLNTLIEIANYFGMSLDDLLLKELSVNSLYRFDIFGEDLAGDVPNNLTPKESLAGILEVPYLELSKRQTYFSSKIDLNRLPVISLPLEKGRRYLSIELGHEAKRGIGLSYGDILVCCLSKEQKPESVELEKVYLFEFEQEFILEKVNAKSMSVLKLGGNNQSSYSKSMDTRQLKKIWELHGSYSVGFIENTPFERRLARLEEKFSELNIDSEKN